MLTRGGVRFVCREGYRFHGGDVLFYFLVLGLQGFGEVFGYEAAGWVGVDDAEGVYLAAVGNDVVLQRGIALVGLAEGGAALHFIYI